MRSAGKIAVAISVLVETTCSRSKSHESTEIHAVSEVVSAKASASAVVAAGPVPLFAVSAHRSCFRIGGGRAVCWLGTINTSTPRQVAATGPITAIATAGDNVCVIDRDGLASSSVFDGHHASWANVFRAAHPGSGDPATSRHMGRDIEVACSPFDACVRLDTGLVGCFGADSAPGIHSPPPTAKRRNFETIVDGLDDEAQVAMGDAHACSRRHDGTVRCWGMNTHGQLGDGTTDWRGAPVAVSSLGGFAVQIALGSFFSCALLIDGRVRCWGANYEQQLGDGSTDYFRSYPSDVPGAKGALWIAAGGTFACVGMREGLVRCWGENNSGQLGDGTFESRSTPTDAIALQGAHAMALGDDAGCALFDHDVPKCWGSLAVDGRVPTTLDLSTIAPASPP